MKEIKYIFVISAAILTLLPGLPFLKSNLVLPIDDNLTRGTFFSVVEILSMLTFLLLWMNRTRIKRSSIRVLNTLSIKLGAFAIIFLILYYFMYNSFVVRSEGYDPVFMPVFHSQKLSGFIQEYGGTAEAIIENHGRDTLVDKINELAKVQLISSIILFLLLYTIFFIPLTSALLIPVIKIQQDAAKDKKRN